MDKRSFLLLLSIALCHLITVTIADCDSGWFGSRCQYKCRCLNNSTCNSTGQCLYNSRCERGWFGLGCQYQDLTSLPTSTLTTTPNLTSTSWLTDNDDTTCNTDQSVQSVSLSWNTSYVFTWLQITVMDPAELRNVNVTLKVPNTTVDCVNKDIQHVYNHTFEIHCNMQTITGLSIDLGNVTRICSLYINGGRNIALKQMASQSSQYTEPGINTSASNAVDGNTNTNFTQNSCTHTKPGAPPYPTWTVIFSHQYLITRFILYNRHGINGPRLQHFNLRTFKVNNSTLFNYTDGSTDNKVTYQVLDASNKDPIKGLTITATITISGDSEPILTLCEVETYGECPPGTWGLECEGCPDVCYNKSCHRDSGWCVKGCQGYRNPPLCTLPCSIGTWGVNCEQKCNSTCYNKSCNRDTGVCDLGCNGFSDFPNCSVACTIGRWGLDCTQNCSENCWNQTCINTSGQCLEGCYGYSNPPICSTECSEGYWGKNCAQKCIQYCNNKTCNKFTSDCDMGCLPGYKPPNCTTECDTGSYGQDCSKNCSTNCTDEKCNVQSGVCFSCMPGFEGDFCTQAISVSDPPLGAIVGPIIAAILVILLIAAILLFWRQHKGKKLLDHTFENGEVSSQTSLPSKTTKEIVDDPPRNVNHVLSLDNICFNEYENTSIAVSDLNSFMYTHTKDYFTAQFQRLPTAKNATTEIGLSEKNKLKNRYNNICAYDHSRVHLEINTTKNEEDSINASYIEGYLPNEKFIASQAPTKHIINDFIRMLWEQRVEKVVMLTSLIEDGKRRSEKYWPDNDSVLFGEIHVKLISSYTFADYTIRTLELSKKNEATQIFTQFHFTSWPDKGVPSVTWGLVEFEQLVSAHPTTRPVVVHCSASVGRTGTFLALLNVLREAGATGRVDFFKTVTKLREDRILMVQTAEQYWFLHQAAQVAIMCIGTTVTSDIVERIKTLEGKSVTGTVKMEEEFKAVCALCENFKENTEGNDQAGEENLYQNNNADIQSKNRYSSIIPKPSYSPSLMCETKDMSSYINAVFIPGFKKRDQQILTQLPMPNTVVDFWRLVTQYKISLIVAFEVDFMTADPSLGKYLPSAADQPLICGHLKIQSDSVNKTSLWEEQKLTVHLEKHKSFISSRGHEESHAVVHLKCMTTDLEPKKLLVFIKQARSYNALAKGMILYTCRNGARYSGLASVLSLLLDRKEHDSCLTVPLVVGSIKSIRPEVIPTLDQYRLLYDVLQQSLDTTQYNQVGDFITTKNNSEANDKETNVYANV